MKSANVFSLIMTVGLIAVAVACTKTVTRVVPTTTASDAGTDGGKVTTKPSPGDDDDTAGDDDDTTGDDDDDDTTSSSGNSSSGSSSSSGGPKVSDCKKKADQQACLECCQEISPDGAQIYAAELRKCVCQDDVCKEDCKTTLCAAQPKNPNPACNTCFQGAQETCAPIVIGNCDADAKCKVFNACVTTAECPNKPAP